MRTVDHANFIQELGADTVTPVRAAGGKKVERDELTRHLNAYLNVPHFKDAAYNGLQVSGRHMVSHVAVGVTANKALIEAAVIAGADTILVHHGLFWKGDDPRLVGYHRERAAVLLDADVNLYAYHLPLDVHAEIGNNVCLGRRLGLSPTGSTGENDLVMLGQLGVGVAVKSAVLAAYCARHYGRRVTLFSSSSRMIKNIGWCTGAGGSLLKDAIAAGADAFITGEVSEHHVHEARESDITLITAGHHATERDGVAALGAHIAQQFGVRYQFIDVDSPL